jgi:hypothetical protein
MSGHGHVTPNPDGSKARCGGPAICRECAIEAGTHAVVSNTHGRPLAPVLGTDRDSHPLDYQAPTAEERYRIEAVTNAIKSAWCSIGAHCPPSAERMLALRALQEARSRANEAILGITIPR